MSFILRPPLCACAAMRDASLPILHRYRVVRTAACRRAQSSAIGQLPARWFGAPAVSFERGEQARRQQHHHHNQQQHSVFTHGRRKTERSHGSKKLRSFSTWEQRIECERRLPFASASTHLHTYAIFGLGSCVIRTGSETRLSGRDESSVYAAKCVILGI